MFSALEPVTRRNLLVLFVVGLLFWCSLASLLPTLPLYIKDAGATNHQVGIVMGAFAIGLLMFRPWLGQLADRRSRKLVLLIGLLSAATAPLGYLMTQSLLPLMVIRVFHGVSIAAFTTAYSALIVDLSPEHHRGEVIGYMSLVTPIGVAVGPAIGGFLQAAAGYMPLFLFAAGSGFVGLVATSQIRTPNSPSTSLTPAPSQNAPFWQLLLSPRLRIPTVTFLLIGLVFGTLSTFVPLFLEETNVNLNAGLFYTAAAIASFCMRVITGRASDRYGRGRFVTLSLVFYVLSMVILWNANSATAFLAAALIEGSGAGIFVPIMIALLADRSHPQERGRIFGLSISGFDLGIAIAGPTLGYFADALGYRSLFGLAAGLALMALVIFISQCSKDLTHSLRFALGKGKDMYAVGKSSEG